MNGVVGVSADAPGVSFWKIKNGIRLTGMASFKHILSDTQIWQVALLLHEAGHPLPESVTEVLNSVNPPMKSAPKKN